MPTDTKSGQPVAATIKKNRSARTKNVSEQAAPEQPEKAQELDSKPIHDHPPRYLADQPLHEHSRLWVQAYSDKKGELPSKGFSELSQRDRDLIVSRLNALEKEQQRKARVAASKALTEFKDSRGIIEFDEETDSIVLDTLINQTNVFEGTATDGEDTFYSYNGLFWETLPDAKVKRMWANEIAQSFFPDGLSAGRVRNLTEMTALKLPVIQQDNTGIMGFTDIAIRIDESGAIEVIGNNSPDLYLTSGYSFPFCPGVKIDRENPQCQNFLDWLFKFATSYDSDGEVDQQASIEKYDLAIAAMYMVITNHHDWQLFVNVTGMGGNGKSVLLLLLIMLAGGDNCTFISSIKAVEQNKKGALESAEGKRLWAFPDQSAYSDSMEVTKKVTGGEPVEVDRMYKRSVAMKFNTVICIVSNFPIASPDKSDGLYRRQVVIDAQYKVTKEEKDTRLISKIESELPMIIKFVLDYFTPDEARNTLENAIENKDKTEAMIETDTMSRFISECLLPREHEKEQVGSLSGYNSAKKGSQYVINRQILAEIEHKLYPLYIYYMETRAGGSAKAYNHNTFTTTIVTRANQLKSLGYTNVKAIKPKNKSTIAGVKINPDSEVLSDLREAAENYELKTDQAQSS